MYLRGRVTALYFLRRAPLVFLLVDFLRVDFLRLVFFFAVFSDLRNAAAVGAPFCPFLRVGRPPFFSRS